MLPIAVSLLQLAVAMPPQDAHLLRDVKGAQGRFETIRRSHLPREWSSRPERCDAHIGRFCYWYDSTESKPGPEPRAIVDARNRFIVFLDSAVEKNPGVAWLSGQRIRYLIEAGRFDAAVAAAQACSGEAWWCAALGGLALHVATRYQAADSAFALALAAAPDAQRCAWIDVSSTLPVSVARAFRKASCAERAVFVQQLWAVSKPLWQTGGNDLRTEHFARLTMAAIYTRTANAYGINWGDDSREMMIRYGWSEWFTRDESSAFAMPTVTPNITGHDREPSYSFYPRLTRLRLQPVSWNLREPTATSRYSPRHIERLETLPHQLVRFPRSDSMLVVAALSIRDTTLGRDSVSTFLGALRDTTLVGVRDTGVTLRLLVARDSAVVDVEAYGTRSHRAARARYALEPLKRADGWSLSDLLLYRASAAGPTRNLDTALAAAVVERVQRSAPLGVLWELERPGASAPMTVAVTVAPARVGVFRKLAGKLHLADEVTPVKIEWVASAPSGRASESVVLRLRPNAHGRYRVTLSVSDDAGHHLSSSRDIDVM